MHCLKILAATALAAAALPAGASARGFGGTYTGTSTEGQPISVQIGPRGKLVSTSGVAVRKLSCTREDRSQPFPNDRMQLPDRNR